MKTILAFLLCFPLFAQTTVDLTGPDGVVRTYTLRDWPYRAWINPTNYDNFKDPDGAGAGKHALYDGAMGQGLRYAIDQSRVTTDYANNYPSTTINPASTAANAALLWAMCNQCVTTWDAGLTWGQYAKNILLNAYAYTNRKMYGTANYGDSAGLAAGYGGGLISDYGGVYNLAAALAYSLLRNEFTSGERTTIAQYYINGLLPEEVCTLPEERQAGVVTKSGNTLTISGSTWDAVVGDLIVVKAYKDTSGVVVDSVYNGSTIWNFVAKVVTKPNSTTITVVSDNGVNFHDFSEGYYSKYRTWQSNFCGANFLGMAHLDFPPYVEAPNTAFAKLTQTLPAITWPAPVGGETGITVTVDVSNLTIPNYDPPSPSKPWRAFIGPGWWTTELIEITGISGNTWTITRGKWWHGRPWPSGEKIRIANIMGNSQSAGNGLNNRNMTRAQTALALALVFCGDSASACTLLQRAVDYFYRELYQQANSQFTLLGFSPGDYQMYRGLFYGRQAMFIQNSISSPSADWTSGSAIQDGAYLYSHWMYPWAPKEGLDVGTVRQFGCTTNYASNIECGHQVVLSNLLFPSDPMTAYSWSFLKDVIGWNLHNGTYTSVWGNYNSGLDVINMSTYQHILSGGASNWPTAADRTTLDTTYVGARDTLTVSSRSDWTTGSSLFAAVTITSSDKLINGEARANSYFLGKKGLLVGGPWLSGVAGRTDRLALQNGLLFGDYTQSTFSNYTLCSYTNFPAGNCPGISAPSYGNHKTSSVWAAVSPKNIWVKPTNPPGLYYWLTNGGQSNLHGINRYWRNYFHLKPTGGRERLIVFDDVSSTVAEKKRVLTFFPQNNEAMSMLSGRSYTEGVTSLAGTFAYVDSRTGTGEGGVVKDVMSWLCAGDNTCPDVYDMPLQNEGGSNGTNTVSVCPQASASMPCGGKFGASSYSFTSPVGTFSYRDSAWASANNTTSAQIWVYFDQADGVFKVVWTSQVVVEPTCTGSVSCVGVGTVPSGKKLMWWYRYAQSGTFNFGCYPLLVNGNEAYGPTAVGNCLQAKRNIVSINNPGDIDNAIPVSVETEASACNTNGCRLYTIHELSEDTGATPSTSAEFSVTSDSGTFKGLVLDANGSTSAITIAPIDQARTTTLSFTNPSSTTTLAVVAGLTEGTYRVLCGGVPHQTGIAVNSGEAMLEIPALPGSCVTVVERTGGATINIAPNPSSITASCEAGGSNPPNQSVAISASGGTLTNVSQSKVGSALWLSVTPPSLSATGNFTLSFNCAGLTANTYTETIRFTSSQPEVTNTPLDVQVTLTVSSPGSISLALNPPTLNFTTTEGGADPSTQQIAFTSPGGVLDNFTVSDNQTWCSVSPSSGTAASTLTVSISNTTLTSAGSPRTCTITVSSTTSGVANSPQQVSAIVTTEAPPSVTMSLGGPLNFAGVIGQGAPENQSLPFTASGIVENYSTSIIYQDGSGWLNISPSAGVTVGTLTVHVDTSSLSVAGQYCATVTATSTDPDVVNSPTASVCIIMSTPTLPPSIAEPANYELILGQQNGFQFSIVNGTGVAPFTWSIGNTVPGLALSETSGTNNTLAGTPTTLGDHQFEISVMDGNGVTAQIQRMAIVRPSPNQADFTVEVVPVEGGAVIHLTLADLNANDEGTVVVRDGSGLLLLQRSIPRGTAVRSLLLDNLPLAGLHSLEFSYPTGAVTSPGVKGSTTHFIPLPVTGATGTLSWRGTPPAGESIDNVAVYYGTDKAAVESGTSSSMTDSSCTSAAECYASASVPLGGYYVLAEFRNGSTVVRRDPIASVIPVLR